MSKNVEVDRLLYTTPEVAAALGVGVTKVKSLIRTGELRSIKIGALRRITVTSLNDYIAIQSLKNGSGA